MFLLACAALFAACQESLEERAAREARELTENKCPMPVADDMVLDSVVFDIPTLTQSQYFRFTGEKDNDSLEIDIDNARKLLVAELKSLPTYKPLIKRGVNFRYVYYSTRNPQNIYLETLLTKEDYQ